MKKSTTTTSKNAKAAKTNKTPNYTKVCKNVYKLGNTFRVCVNGKNGYFTKRKDALAFKKELTNA